MKNEVSNRDALVVIALVVGYLFLIWLTYRLHSYWLFTADVTILVGWLVYILTPQRVVRYITIIYRGDKPVEVKEVVKK